MRGHSIYKVFILNVLLRTLGDILKPEGHFEKAKAFENRAQNWETDRDAPSVIEDIFDAAVHYLAYSINIKYGKDIDSHSGLKRFLRNNNENKVHNAFSEIEYIRIGSVYGGSWNGYRIKKALENWRK